MAAYTCLLLDDEPIALNILAAYLAKIPELQLLGCYQDPLAAIQVLREQEVDLLFLDIEMPELNGLQLIRSLAQPPAIILTTAHREYALEGFELAVVDYLLKPIAFPRFLKAVNRFLENVPRDQPIESDSIFVREDRRSVRVKLSEILWVEGLKDYVRIHTSSRRIVVKSSLGGFGRQLPSGAFIRIHRSFLVAQAHIKAFNGEEVEVPGKVLPLGRTYKNDFLQAMNRSGD